MRSAITPILSSTLSWRCSSRVTRSATAASRASRPPCDFPAEAPRVQAPTTNEKIIPTPVSAGCRRGKLFQPSLTSTIAFLSAVLEVRIVLLGDNVWIAAGDDPRAPRADERRRDGFEQFARR